MVRDVPIIAGVEEANIRAWITPWNPLYARDCESEAIAALFPRLGDYNESERGGEGLDFAAGVLELGVNKRRGRKP
jgi:hypothetical protein